MSPPGGQALLAIDSGQTAIKVRAVTSGRRFGQAFPGARTSADLLPQIADVIAAATRATGEQYPVVAIGTSGLTEDDNNPAAVLAACSGFGVRRVFLAHDSITSYLGAVGHRRGVVVAAGTGAVTLGVGADRHSRVDGWGYIMGDAGSGYWIGKRALEDVMRAHDGRGPATALTEVVRNRYPDLEKAYILLQTDPDAVRVVASLATQVAQLGASDPVAATICEEAGAQLARSAAVATRSIGEDVKDNPLICLVGGVFNAPRVLDSCVAHLRDTWPRFEPFVRRGDGLDGAEVLHSTPANSPLASLIASAEA